MESKDENFRNIPELEEGGDSVVVCLTRDQGGASLSLTRGTALSLSMLLHPLLSTGSTEEMSWHD